MAQKCAYMCIVLPLCVPLKVRNGEKKQEYPNMQPDISDVKSMIQHQA